MTDLTKHSQALQDLCGCKISIHYVSGADIFYSDGAAAGATYRLQMPDSKMVYVCADGSEHWVTNSSCYTKHAATIQQYIAQELTLMRS